MASEMDDKRALQRCRQAKQCVCSDRRAKKTGGLFCNQCFQVLADDSIRGERYKLSGLLSEEMAAAYRACLEFLQDQGFVRDGVRLG